MVDGHPAVPVEYLGVWDTVKAVGFLRGQVQWPYTRSLPNVRSLRHAVSIDERRAPYHEYLVEPKGPWPQGWEETWFAGVHSDVGGTFVGEPRLSTIPLKWIVDGARSAGMVVRPHVYRRECTVTDENARGAIHPSGGLWWLLGTNERRILPGSQVHASVQVRIESEPDYAARVPGEVVWADAFWTRPFGEGMTP